MPRSAHRKASSKNVKPQKRKRKRRMSPAQLAALAKGRAAMAARRKGKKRSSPGKLTPRRKRRKIRSNMARRRKARRSTALVSGRRHGRARHALRAIGGVAAENKHMTGAILGAAALGIAKKQGLTIPHVETVGEAGSLAIAGYLLDKFGIVKNRMLRHATTGFACIAVYEAASSGNIPFLSEGKGKKGKTEGEDDLEGASVYNVR